MKHGGGSVDVGNNGVIKGMMFVGGTKGMCHCILISSA